MQIRIKLKKEGNFKNLSQESLRKAIEKALKRATKRYHEMVHEWIDGGKSFTPRTGNLQRSIVFDLKSWHTGVIRALASYAPFVEYGTRPHEIRPKDAKALYFVKDGKEIVVKRVRHPGSKPYPFLFADLENRKKKFKEPSRRSLKNG